MKELLQHLTPDDDGRAFTDAVMLRAAGALHRRRTAAEASLQRPAWDWLALWARPWLVAALVLIAAVTMIPAVPWSRGSAVAAPAPSEAMNASLLPADLAMAATTEAT